MYRPDDRLARHLRRRRRGAAAAEFALVSVVFFAVLFGIIEFGELVMVNNLLDGAAREGARLAVVNTNQGGALTGLVRAEVVRRLGGTTARLAGFDPLTDITVTVV